MSKINNSRIQSNLLQQNCFVRDVTRVGGISVSSSPESFLSIDEVVTSKGVELVESDNPYPITPQYVKSFVDSADYHNDPFGSIVSPRQNLGDITAMQKVSSMDTEQARNLYAQLSDVFSKSDSSKSDSSQSGGGDNV